MNGPTPRRMLLIVALLACRKGEVGGEVADGVAEPWLAAPEPRLLVRSRKCMGTECTITAFHADEAAFEEAARRGFYEMDRIELAMTDWRDTSDVSRVNRAAGGRAVVVSTDTLKVLAKARWIADLSAGAFDVTVGVFRGLWKFDEDSDGSIPERSQVSSRRRLVDYRDVVLDASKATARLRRPGQRITLGGIAKGYAVDAAVAAMRASGIVNFMVQAGGDLYAAGRRGERAWKVGIQDPRAPRDLPKSRATSFAVLSISDEAFNTSGDYERFVMRDGVRYHHLLDPRTGFPAGACRSVTILAADAFTADAVDTAAFVMGPESGMKLIEDLATVEGVIVTAENRVLISSGLKRRLEILREPTGGP